MAFPVARATLVSLGFRSLGGVAAEAELDDVVELLVDRDGSTFAWMEEDGERVRLRLLSRLEDDTLIETTSGDPGLAVTSYAAGWTVVGGHPDDWRSVVDAHHDRLGASSRERGAAAVMFSLVGAVDALERRADVGEGPAKFASAIAGVATALWAVSLVLLPIFGFTVLFALFGWLGALGVTALMMIAVWALGMAGLVAWSRVIGPTVGAWIPYPGRRRVGGGDPRSNPYA